MKYQVRQITEITEDFIKLTKELDEEIANKNGEKQKQYDCYNKLEGIRDIVIAYDDNKAIGCGSIKKYDENTYEVKRVYVNKHYRGKGISKGIMEELEKRAKELGIKRLILETSRTFAEAINLYKGIGYKEIENYGQYTGMELSICMEKQQK